MTNRQRTILGVVLFVPVAAVLATMFACLPAPVGDPEKSSMDEKLSGVWLANAEKDQEKPIIVLRPWDEHTYYLVFLNGKKGEAADKAMHFKAWLTKLGNATFLTAESVDSLEFAFPPGPGEESGTQWIVGRVEQKGDTVTFRMVNEKSWIVKDLKTREKLEAAMAAQVDNKDLYNEAQTFQRVTKDKLGTVKDVLNESGISMGR
jgi:hypothetical protein